jgi:hypothetical protein
MTATPAKYRTPYVSQMLAEPDRTYDDCAASTGIMLFNDWTLGEWSTRPDGKQRDLLLLRNTVRKRIGDTDGGLTLHDVNDIGHELDPDLPDLPRYNGQAAKPGQSTKGATLRLDRAELKALLMNGHSAAICGLSGTVGHVVHVTDGTAAGVLRKDPLTRKGENWAGDRITWSQLWAFTEADRNGKRQYGSPDAIACAVVKVGEQTEAARIERKAGTALERIARQRDAQKAQTALATDERDQARRELAASQKAYTSAMDALGKANADIDACKAQTGDCHETMDRAIAAEKRVADAIAVLTR